MGRRNSFDATFGEPNRMELVKPEMGMDGTAGRSTQIGHEVFGTDTGSAGMTPKALLVCFSGEIGSGKTSTSNAVKRFGTDGIPSGQAQIDYGVIRTKLEEIGIYLIPVGEIENFCRELGSHGPKFVARLLSKNDLSDANLDGLRSFVERVHTGPYGK